MRRRERRRTGDPTRSLVRALGMGRRGVTAFVGAGGKTAAIRRLLAERPRTLATTTTHLERSGFARGLLVVFPDATALAGRRPALQRAWPLTVAVDAGERLQGPSLVWLEAILRAEPRCPVLVEADGAARRLLKLPAAGEPAWPPTPLGRVVIVVGLAALGRPLPDVAHHPERFGHAGAVGLADVRRMLDAYLERLPPAAAISVLLTGAHGVSLDVLAGLVRHVERRVRGRDPRRQDPNVSLRVVTAADVASGALRVWECAPGGARRRVALPGVCGVLLAAGAGRRFGRTPAAPTKLLQRWRGKPLVAHAAERLVRAGCAAVVVVTGRDPAVAAAVVRAVHGHGAAVRLLCNRDPGRGLGSSVRAAARVAPRGLGLLFAHADMPRVRVTTLQRIARLGTTLQHCIVQPTVRGTPRNPVFFPAALRGALARLDDATGGKAVLRQHPELVFGLDCAPGDDLVDVDRRADLERLSAKAASRRRARPRPKLGAARRPILLVGAGDLGSGAAEALVRAGFPVVIAEKRRPLAVRRKVAFAEAARAGETVVEGIRCRRVPLAALVAQGWPAPGRRDVIVPLVVEPWQRVLEVLRPEIVVDARMTKRPARGLSRRVFRIALGPGHTAGGDCDAVVETVRGPELGRVLWRGQAQANTGVPGEVGGATESRLVRAPAAGRFQPHVDIGTRVHRGALLAHVGRRGVRARLSGVVRGMLAPGERVRPGQKLGDIDPRRRQPPVDRISDKARAVGRGVLAAVRASGRSTAVRRRRRLQRQRA